MAGIVGTITNLSDFLSKTQVCLSVKPNDPQQQSICLEADRKYSIPAFQREVRWDDNNLKMLLYDLSRSSKFLGNIILTIKSDHTCEIIDGQQRTTVLMLIISCIKKKFGTKISTPDLCPLRNEGFTGFQTLLEKAFDQEAITSDDWNAILKSDALSFSGSINDSKHGFQNYESIKVFKTWAGTQEYVDADTARFEKIWNRKDRNLKMFTIPQAVKNKIFELRSPDRPYSLPAGSSKWVHQDIAVKTFLEKEHGILAMATGTGKTVTAMKIINKLFDSGEIRRVVITMYGNDLLDQWAIQIRENYKNKQINYHYASQKMMKDFVMHPDDSILILSRDARNLSKLLDLFDRLPGDYHNDTLFVFDEVHGAGSNTFVENLSGRLSPYRYRLGLSATPEREYDEAGNDFLLNEIGEVIFEFTLQDAIQKGILCEFNYIPLPYVLSDEEKLKKRKIIAAFNAKKESGEPVDEKDMFTQLALVNKTAVNKLEEFESLISQRPELLQKCIIFVQTMEYGAKLQEILVRYSDKYHTYYADDEKINLENFAAGKIDCLLTCKKVSEGIDISSVTNIILFSSDRSRLVTTQRIGRALRLDKNNPEKKATVVDFVIEDSEKNDNNADADRAEWLTDLSQTRRCEHEK